ncbi:MAG: primosomal protein N' [Firmicutes bacterium]|nr:primosomal protein N' [Bacillota bacterium]
MTYCEVAVEIAHESVSRLFTYRVPEGVALAPGTRVLVPFGARKVEGYVLRVKDGPGDVPADKVREVLRPLEEYPALLPGLIDLAFWLAEETRCLPVEALRLMIPAQMRGGRVRVKATQMARLAVAPEALDAAMDSQKRAPRRLRILEALAQGDQPAARLRAISADGVTKLVSQGIVALYGAETLRRPYAPEADAAPEPELTEDQCRVLEEILPALQRGEGRFLLSGVTGSGKTEVYIRAVREVLGMGRAAIVLVPEIALTPQMVGWFRQRFGESSAVLHSRLSAGERYDEWRRIRRGEARVVIGARSAVFAPAEGLGIVIVDEEHEQTYLSDHHPRYDAREVAQRRCAAEGATLLLASATPSLKSFSRTVPTLRSSLGPLTLLEMPRRVLSRSLPDIEVVDMRGELERGNRSVFSRPLDTALRECFARGEQAMLFINRRGYSTFVSCRACGKALRCESCDVSLTYHRHEDVMRCHYCGFEQKPPETCPHCGSPAIRYFGAGTQKVEEAVRQRFPGVPAVRMDMDTTRGKDGHAKLLDTFRRGEARVLIGTQMIAKGLDFPRVTLVGVVAADATLNLPDYRSPERTFALIVQVAGRAGRAEQKGRVIVQTYDPEHYAIAAAQRQDFRAFFHTEFERRRRGLYPPFTRIARLLVEGRDAKKVQGVAEALYEETDAFLSANPRLKRQVVQMRAMEAPVKMIRGNARWQVFLKLYARGPTQAVLEKLDECKLHVYDNVNIYVEVDPANMM